MPLQRQRSGAHEGRLKDEVLQRSQVGYTRFF